MCSLPKWRPAQRKFGFAGLRSMQNRHLTIEPPLCRSEIELPRLCHFASPFSALKSDRERHQRSAPCGQSGSWAREASKFAVSLGNCGIDIRCGARALPRSSTHDLESGFPVLLTQASLPATGPPPVCIESPTPVTDKQSPRTDPYEFILENIDSVPHLEALILFWNSRPVGWTCEEMASRLYVPIDSVATIIRDLVRLQVVQEQSAASAKFSYRSGSDEQDDLMRRIDEAYRRDLVRISTMVHSKASSPVREFARAFRLRKDRDS